MDVSKNEEVSVHALTVFSFCHSRGHIFTLITKNGRNERKTVLLLNTNTWKTKICRDGTRYPYNG